MKKLMTAATLALLTLDVCPQTGRWYGPKADAQAREDFKKNSRKHWQAPPKL